MAHKGLVLSCYDMDEHKESSMHFEKAYEAITKLDAPENDLLHDDKNWIGLCTINEQGKSLL